MPFHLFLGYLPQCFQKSNLNRLWSKSECLQSLAIHSKSKVFVSNLLFHFVSLKVTLWWSQPDSEFIRFLIIFHSDYFEVSCSLSFILIVKIRRIFSATSIALSLPLLASVHLPLLSESYWESKYFFSRNLLVENLPRFIFILWKIYQSIASCFIWHVQEIPLRLIIFLTIVFSFHWETTI